MQAMSAETIDHALQTGYAALQSARFQDAIDVFNTLSEDDTADPRICLGLAIANRAVGDFKACLTAIDAYLAQDKSQPSAFVIRGDALKGLGEQRRAVAAYMVALQSVSPGTNIDARTQQELQRAQAECAAAKGLYESYLRDHVKGALGSGVEAAGTRSSHALDLIFGKRQIYQQQPHRFYFPEMPQRQFYERSEFDWADALEAASAQIKAEYTALAAEEGRFGAYVTDDGREPHLRQHTLTNNKNWSAIHLIRNGERFEENIAQTPRTMAALDHAPIPDVVGQSPSALFSRLLPGAHIPPHNGLTNTRLICHLPLILPGQCTIRVGNETRSWQGGQLLIFDDSIQHEARNASNAPRAVLIFDIWRPELSEDERALVKSVFAGIEAFGA